MNIQILPIKDREKDREFHEICVEIVQDKKYVRTISLFMIYNQL